MKKTIGIVMVLLMLMSVTGALADVNKDAQPENVVEYKRTLEIDTPEPVIETYLGYQVPRTRGYNFMTEPSVPMLPVKSFSLVIPNAAEIKSIKVVSSTKEELHGCYDICPVQEPVPTSRNAPVRFTPKNPSIYASSNPYPGKLFEYAGEGNMRDYRILSVFVYPLQYNPAGKKLTLYMNVKIEVTYTVPPTEPKEIEQDDEFASMVKALVSNPEDVDTFPTAATATTSAVLSPDDVKYVIITDSTFETEFQVLADWKTARGVPANVVNVSWIESNYAGGDTQEQIRNFINDSRHTWGTKWVLLGGDTNVVPHRLAYSNFQSENTFIPTDLYYSDLDGNWNADGDSKYGEVADDIDFYPDVFVGRAPVDEVDEVNTFVNKTIAYEKGPSGYETTALFMAEYLDIFTNGAVTKNLIEDESIPDTFSVTKLYQSLGNLNHDSAVNELNEGYGIVNHVGHGGVDVIGTGLDALYSSDMDSLHNGPNESVFYSMSCWSNAFEQDSFSEHFVLNPNGGGIAYIGNSRYGWYIKNNPGYGPSDLYDREFFKSLFNKELYHIGETLADSKITFISDSKSGDTVNRWIQYSLNLLGDPETRIWTTSISKPPELSVTVDAPAKVSNYNTFAVTATISNAGTDTATGVNATINWNPELGLSTTDPLTKSVGDSEIVSWHVSASSEGIYDITVEASATNATPANDTTTVEVIGYIDDVTNADMPVKGEVTGDHLDTHESENTYESITEVESGGRPSNRYSYLEHKWTVDVTGGSEVTFHLEAYRSSSSDGDDFVFAYSTDDSTYTKMVTVTKTTDNGSYQTFDLLGDLSGTVYIRVMDADRTWGNRSLDTIHIDQMFIRSESGPPSYGVAVTIDEASQTVAPGNSTTYTVRTKNTGDLNASYSVVMGGAAVDDSNITVSPLNWNTSTLSPNAENVQTVTVSTAANTPETAYTLTATATCDQNTSVTNSVNSELVVSSATNAMHVASIDMSLKTAGPNTNAIALVTIVDATGVPVGGATVEGHWSNATIDTDSGLTGASGEVVLNSDKVKNAQSGTTNFTFTVDDVSLAGWTYDPDTGETSDSITVP